MNADINRLMKNRNDRKTCPDRRNLGWGVNLGWSANLSLCLGLGMLLSISSLSCWGAETEPATQTAKNVTTAAFKDIRTYVSHTLGGVVPAEQDSDISAQISAVIDAFHVDKGQEVKKDDLLVSLDCRENQLRLDQEEASLKAEQVQLALARTQFDQARKLDRQGNISKELYNQREAEQNRLQATVANRKAGRDLARIKVGHCEIKAPFDGYITSRDASVGELTRIGTPLLHLVSKNNKVVDVEVNDRLLDNFTQGSHFRFEYNSNSYPLQIKFILPVLDVKSRNHIARLEFIDERAVTGSVGKVTWQDSAASLPSDYIVLRDNKLGVLVDENNTAKFIEINNASEGQSAFVELDDATRVITHGRYNVEQGDKLIVND